MSVFTFGFKRKSGWREVSKYLLTYTAKNKPHDLCHVVFSFISKSVVFQYPSLNLSTGISTQAVTGSPSKLK